MQDGSRALRCAIYAARRGGLSHQQSTGHGKGSHQGSLPAADCKACPARQAEPFAQPTEHALPSTCFCAYLHAKACASPAYRFCAQQFVYNGSRCVAAGEQKFPAFSLHIAPALQPQQMFTGPSALKELAKALAGQPTNASLAEVSLTIRADCIPLCALAESIGGQERLKRHGQHRHN